MDRGTWQATVQWVANESDTTEATEHTHTSYIFSQEASERLDPAQLKSKTREKKNVRFRKQITLQRKAGNGVSLLMHVLVPCHCT